MRYISPRETQFPIFINLLAWFRAARHSPRRIALVLLLAIVCAWSSASALGAGRRWIGPKPPRPHVYDPSPKPPTGKLNSRPTLQEAGPKIPGAETQKGLVVLRERGAFEKPKTTLSLAKVSEPKPYSYLSGSVFASPAQKKLANQLTDHPIEVLRRLDENAAKVISARSNDAIRRAIVPIAEFHETVSIDAPLTHRGSVVSQIRRESASEFASLVAMAVLEEALPASFVENVEPGKIQANAWAAINRAERAGINAIGDGAWIHVLKNEFRQDVSHATVRSRKRESSSVSVEIETLTNKAVANIKLDSFSTRVGKHPNEPSIEKLEPYLLP